MSKNLGKLKEISENEKDFKSLRLQDLVLYYLIPVLEDFEKSLTELEKYKSDMLVYHEINETGGINNIKIVLDDPNKKEEVV